MQHNHSTIMHVIVWGHTITLKKSTNQFHLTLAKHSKGPRNCRCARTTRPRRRRPVPPRLRRSPRRTPTDAGHRRGGPAGVARSLARSWFSLAISGQRSALGRCLGYSRLHRSHRLIADRRSLYSFPRSTASM